MTLPAQIAILLALNAALFDPVPLEQMTAAQQAVEAAANGLPAALGQRLADAGSLTDADREQVTALARQALAAFLPASEQA